MPGAALGLRTLFGTAEEVTYGTAVAIDRRYEFTSDGLEVMTNVLQSQGISGAFTSRRSARRTISSEGGGGTVGLEVAYTGLGRWLKHMAGGTPTVVQQAATIAYLHTYAAGSLLGKSLTVQKSIRDGDGTENETWTFSGGKVTSWTLTAEVDSIAGLEVALDFRQGVTSVANTALAALATPVSPVFNFKQGSVLVNATPVARVLSARATGDNALKTDSYVLGSNGLKGEPEINDFRTLEGTLSTEFVTTTLYDLFKADTACSLKLEFVGPIIASTYAYRLTLDVPAIHFTGSTPTVGGPGVVEMDAPWEAAIDASGNPLYTLSYMTTDTAV